MAVSRRNRVALRQLVTLFDVGAIGDCTDGQLLERFANQPNEAAELAFAAIVERHGPMVLRVCQLILGDEHAAEDAFQSTFVVLVRKAPSLWVLDSLGPWLYQVAFRTASCALADRQRRRRHEARYGAIAASAAATTRTASDPETELCLHHEIDRLPERYRAPIILCDLEGQTHQQAARQLGWPVGTVKTRLTRARDILRERLVGRQVAVPSAVTALATLADRARTSVPAELARRTVETLSRQVGHSIAGAAASIEIVALANRTVRTWFVAKLRASVLGLLVIGIGLTGAFAAARRQQPALQNARDLPANAPIASTKAGDPADAALLDLLEEASRATKGISNARARWLTYSRIGSSQAALGDRAGRKRLSHSRESAAQISEEMWQPFSIWSVAKRQAEIGDVESARKTFGELLESADGKSPADRVDLLCNVAKEQWQAGLKADARKTINTAQATITKIWPTNEQDRGRYRAGVAQLAIGDFEAVLADAESLPGKASGFRQSLLEAIAENCDRAGRVEARKILTRSFELSKGLSYGVPRAVTQKGIVRAMARNGDVAGRSPSPAPSVNRLRTIRRPGFSNGCSARAIARAANCWNESLAATSPGKRFPVL